MIRLFILITQLSFLFLDISAQPSIFAANEIPEKLVKNANSVKRYEKVEFTVHAIDRAEYKVHRIVTVLNAEGAGELVLVQGSDKFTSFESAEIILFDSEGKLIGRFSKKDMRVSYSSDGLVEDGKIFSLSLPAKTFPITAEFKYSLKYRGTLNYPTYQVQGPEESVENSEFTVKVPATVGVRYKPLHIDAKPSVSNEKNASTFVWQFGSLPAIKDEVHAAHLRDRFPAIQTAPNFFEMSGYTGDFTSWKNFGMWMNELCKGRDQLSPEKQAYFRDLVKQASNDSEKASIIYQYLQQNFRYVSIQLGIGGWQPFAADVTEKRKFGDCKALSNYMKAALNAVGVKSHLALVNAASNGQPIDPDFPSNRFNHMILCIPQKVDTIWLECTSATTPFNTLGSFTENRNALLITDEGGKMAATPRSESARNLLNAYTVITMEADGSAEAITEIRTSGEFKDYAEYLNRSDENTRLDFLVKNWEFKQPDEFLFIPDKESSCNFKLNFTVRKIYEFNSGSKFFISPRISSIAEQSLPENNARRLDYYFAFPFIKCDTTIFVLNTRFEVETLPADVKLTTDLGNFFASYSYDKESHRIITSASFTLFNNRIPPAKYVACREFISKVIKEHTEKIIIKKL